MPRRPDFIKTLLVAGLICLGVFLSHRGWCREVTGAPARFAETGQLKPGIPPASIQLAAAAPRQAAPGGPTRPEGTATSPSYCEPLRFRWLTGGLLTSLLCHYVYGYPLSFVWREGLWPPGILDFLVVIALYYVGYRLYRRLKERGEPAAVEAPPRFLKLAAIDPPPLTVREEARPGLAAIQEVDQDFDITVFGEEARLLLLELYAGWNREEINSLNGRVKESLLEYLLMGLKIMSLREERSYLEDMVLEGITVTDARVDDGKELITVCFRGRLLDYVLEKASGKLLLGSLAYPATFQEYWDLERPRGQGTWVLQDIRDG
jgi:hypothetical protein